jgi:hypothetical protein
MIVGCEIGGGVSARRIMSLVVVALCGCLVGPEVYTFSLRLSFMNVARLPQTFFVASGNRERRVRPALIRGL